MKESFDKDGLIDVGKRLPDNSSTSDKSIEADQGTPPEDNTGLSHTVIMPQADDSGWSELEPLVEPEKHTGRARRDGAFHPLIWERLAPFFILVPLILLRLNCYRINRELGYASNDFGDSPAGLIILTVIVILCVFFGWNAFYRNPEYYYDRMEPDNYVGGLIRNRILAIVLAIIAGLIIYYFTSRSPSP